MEYCKSRPARELAGGPFLRTATRVRRRKDSQPERRPTPARAEDPQSRDIGSRQPVRPRRSANPKRKSDSDLRFSMLGQLHRHPTKLVARPSGPQSLCESPLARTAVFDGGDIEFLKNLETDSAPVGFPQPFAPSLSSLLLPQIGLVDRINQNVGVNEDVGGHVPAHATSSGRRFSGRACALERGAWPLRNHFSASCVVLECGFEEERLADGFRERVGETIAEVQAGGMATFAIVGEAFASDESTSST
jgi:hypothetical protein